MEIGDKYFKKYWSDLDQLCRQVDISKLLDCADLMKKCKNKRGKVLVVGNGGSAAIAAHVAVDLTKAAGIRAICFNDASLLTCFGNDFGYNQWVKKAIEFYGDENDLAVLISSSGQSENILNAASYSAEAGMDLITLSGFKADNPLRKYGTVSLWLDSSSYNHIETIHQTWLLSVIDYIIEQERDI